MKFSYVFRNLLKSKKQSSSRDENNNKYKGVAKYRKEDHYGFEEGAHITHQDIGRIHMNMEKQT